LDAPPHAFDDLLHAEELVGFRRRQLAQRNAINRKDARVDAACEARSKRRANGDGPRKRLL
jgi:hypothetical protein